MPKALRSSIVRVKSGGLPVISSSTVRKKRWLQDTSLLDIRYADYTAEANRTIHAVELSLTDVWNGFAQSYENENHVPFYNRIPDDKGQQPDFLIASIPALKLVPIPFNSDLSTLFPDTVKITDDMQKAGQLLYYRSFVRSRTANSLVLGLNITPSFDGVYYEGLEFRLNIGNPISVYSLNKYGGKRGTVDYWMGYTLAYSFGRYYDMIDFSYLDDIDVNDPGFSNAKPPVTHQIRLGFRNNIDFWVAEKRFLGVSNYMDAGVQITKGKVEFVFVPTVALQFGSLFKINYYNMPAWARLPLQLILPLKLKAGAMISPHNYPAFFTGIDLDLLF